MNSLGYTKIPDESDSNTGRVNYDSVTIAKVCELKGYTTVVKQYN